MDRFNSTVRMSNSSHSWLLQIRMPSKFYAPEGQWAEVSWAFDGSLLVKMRRTKTPESVKVCKEHGGHAYTISRSLNKLGLPIKTKAKKTHATKTLEVATAVTPIADGEVNLLFGIKKSALSDLEVFPSRMGKGIRYSNKAQASNKGVTAKPKASPTTPVVSDGKKMLREMNDWIRQMQAAGNGVACNFEDNKLSIVVEVKTAFKL